MDQHRSELHKSSWRMGKVMRDHGPKIFQIETTLNTDTFPKPFALPVEARVGVERQATGRRTWPTAKSLAQDAAAARPQDLPRHRGTAPDDERPVRRGRSGAQGHHGERLPPAARRGAGPDRHPHDGHPVHLPVQRELDHEPDPGDVHRPRLLLQPVPRHAARARGRRDHPHPPDAQRVPPGAPPELHRLLRGGARRHDRPARDVEEVGAAVRRGRLVPPPVPHVERLPRRPPVLHVVLGQPTR